MAKRPTITLIALGLLFLAAVIWNASRKADPDAFIRKEAVRMQERTTPTGATCSPLAGISRSAMTVSTSWSIKTDQDWSAFSAWVADQLKPDFRTITITDVSAEFVEDLPGDSLHLRLTRTDGSIRAVFTGYAE